MATPQTNGILRTKLADMKIGDYLKCELNHSAGDVGIFTGEFLNNAVGTYAEMSLTGGIPANYDGTGFFYFLKVDTGLLIADRKVIYAISPQLLNTKNYLLGSKIANNAIIRCLSKDEWLKYITNSDLNGNIIKQDPNVWHGQTGDASTGISSTAYCDINQDRVGSTVRLSLYMNGSQRSATSNGVIITQGEIPAYHTYNSATTSIGSYYSYPCFRPALEYIDNDKSTNLYY